MSDYPDFQWMGEDFSQIRSMHPWELPTTPVDIQKSNKRDELMNILREKIKPLQSRTQREVLEIFRQIQR